MMTPPLSALEKLRRAYYKTIDLDRLIETLVLECREDGESWSAIANQLGVTKQAAQQRYGR